MTLPQIRPLRHGKFGHNETGSPDFGERQGCPFLLQGGGGLNIRSGVRHPARSRCSSIGRAAVLLTVPSFHDGSENPGGRAGSNPATDTGQLPKMALNVGAASQPGARPACYRCGEIGKRSRLKIDRSPRGFLAGGRCQFESGHRYGRVDFGSVAPS